MAYPAVINAVPCDNYLVHIAFDNGEQGFLDMKPYLDFGVFQRLWNVGFFKQVRVAFDTLEWAAGVDLDPEFVYEKCVKDVGVKPEV